MNNILEKVFLWKICIFFFDNYIKPSIMLNDVLKVLAVLGPAALLRWPGTAG